MELIEPDDSDGDGVCNIDEIDLSQPGTINLDYFLPGISSSVPRTILPDIAVSHNLVQSIQKVDQNWKMTNSHIKKYMCSDQ